MIPEHLVETFLSKILQAAGYSAAQQATLTDGLLDAIRKVNLVDRKLDAVLALERENAQRLAELAAALAVATRPTAAIHDAHCREVR